MNDLPILDEFGVAADIIIEREKGLTKAQAIGPVLGVSDDVSTFNEVWGDIEVEKRALQSISPGIYKTETGWKTALSSAIKYLDASKWVAGVKAEQGVTSWTALKAKYDSDGAV